QSKSLLVKTEWGWQNALQRLTFRRETRRRFDAWPELPFRPALPPSKGPRARPRTSAGAGGRGAGGGRRDPGGAAPSAAPPLRRAGFRRPPAATSSSSSFSSSSFSLAPVAAGQRHRELYRASEDLLKQHYIDLKDRPFYPGLVKYMNSGPIVAMVWEGLNVVKTGRVMLGETNPADSKPGTIRGDFCIQVGRNIIHGSDSVESAQKEINLWFKPAELVDFKSCAHDWIYE
uniref:Nucleoside diphosphate kinase n=1 Tax=Dromaius novaehollandiae TaxID=8790 RepID=A0A8C4K189_DRONO